MPQKPDPSSDLRGAGRLITDAVHGIVDLVEAVHHSIITFGGLLGGSKSKRTSGITGMVYSNIRSTTGLVGQGIEVVLAKLSFLEKEKGSSPEREAVLSALNGVVGDHLEKTQNPLALPMQLRTNGKSLSSEDPSFSELLRQSNGKIALLIHGSCLNDLQWLRQGHDHGSALSKDLGYLPIYLRYNTGRHISENGRDCANLLETFTAQLPQSIELIIIGHSMGGLVARSACNYGTMANHKWRRHLQKMIFLATPHHGGTPGKDRKLD